MTDQELREGGQEGVSEELEGAATPGPTAEPDSPKQAPERQPVELTNLPEFKAYQAKYDREKAEAAKRIADLETKLAQQERAVQSLPHVLAQRGMEEAADELPDAMLGALADAEYQQLKRNQAQQAEIAAWEEGWRRECDRHGLDFYDPVIRKGLDEALRSGDNTPVLDAIYEARKAKEVADMRAEEERKRQEERQRLQAKQAEGHFDAMPTAGGTPPTPKGELDSQAEEYLNRLAQLQRGGNYSQDQVINLQMEYGQQVLQHAERLRGR